MRVNGMMAGGPPEGGEDNIFTRDRPTRGGMWARRGVVLGAAGLLLVVIYMWQRGEGGALNLMSPAQRAVFFEETRDAIREKCFPDGGTVPPRARRRCEKQAEFLQRFPECDEACRQEVAPLLPRAGG